MQTLRTENGYKIEFNGTRTYFVISTFDNGEEDDCIFVTDTERKANNFLNRALQGE